jgi:alpha-L-rhamnosidase
VNRFGRRGFLASSAGVVAGTAAAGALPALRVGAIAAEDVLLGSDAFAVSNGSLRTADLTVNGAVDPVGVDPDAVWFAWTLRAPGRSAYQSGYRIVVRRTDPGHTGTVWDSGTVVSGQQAFVAFGGASLASDAAYQWTVQPRSDADRWGAVSSPARFTTGLRDADWTASWLTPVSQVLQPDRVTYFRSEVTPPAGSLHRATAYISAAHTYRLYLDGTPVDGWPSFSYPDEQYVRGVDLTTMLRPGRTSAIGVLHRWYGGGQGRPTSSPGLLLQLTLSYADGSHVAHVSDGSWRQHPAEWLPSAQRNSDGGDFVEWVDSRQHPAGWANPGFDDSSWSPPSIAGSAGTAPFLKTFAQRTTITETAVSPVRLHTAGGATVADFGAVYAARPVVHFASGEPGRTVSMRVGYLLDPDGQVSTLHGTQGTNLSFSYVMGPGSQTFEAFTFLGFRYLQIEGAGQSFGPADVTALARHTAMPAVPMATFSSGNRMLDAVWRLNTHSCLYCSQEQFIDTPTREKGQFVWDAANSSEGVMRAYGEQNLTWQGLRDVVRGQARYWPDGRINAVYPNDDGARDIPTFTARYPEWLWRYYLSTGDRATVVGHYTSVTKVADWLWARRGPSGLLYGLAFGSNNDPVYGYDLSVTADATGNALSVNAFRKVGQVAALAGDQGGAALWSARADQLSAAINAALRRPDGTYVDGLEANGAQSTHASQEANALALAYGIVPAADVAGVGHYVASLGISVGPIHGLELLRALAAADMPEAVVHTLTDASIPGWAHIVASGGTFTWETWVPSDLIGDSMSHGWASSALAAMQESLLGVTFIDPNLEGTVHVAVTPPRGGLTRASGSVPTVAGPVQVSWQRRGAGMALDVTIPANTSALVHLPYSQAASVREGGVAVGHAAGVVPFSVSGGTAVLSIGSGSYRFTSA